MRYPSFIAEMALPANRHKLRFSVTSGYSLLAAFVALGVAAQLAGILPFHRAFIALLAFKLATNTVAALCLKRDRVVLETTGINVFADILAMTGLIYFTGGVLSPLFPIYAIEITVVALLSNLGITVAIAAIALALYAAMAVLVQLGVLPANPPPVTFAGGVSHPYVAINIAFAAFVLGVPTYFTANILRDLRAKQRALEARTAALVEAGKQKSQFMANVTHELRTPIHGICGLSDLVDSGIYGPVSTKQREAQQGIKRSARSLLQLIDDLLELSRADAGKIAFRTEVVDLGELVPTVVSTVRWMQGTKPLVIDTTLGEDLPRVETDSRKLNQVLLNLLSNAVKFTPENGHIAVRVTKSTTTDGQAAVRFEVEDDGIGIPAEEQARIFDEFRQVDGSAERRFGGIGLGLALVKRMTELLQGTITLESAEGRGSTFALTIPVHRREEARDEERAPRAA